MEIRIVHAGLAHYMKEPPHVGDCAGTFTHTIEAEYIRLRCPACGAEASIYIGEEVERE